MDVIALVACFVAVAAAGVVAGYQLGRLQCEIRGTTAPDVDGPRSD